MEDVKPYKVAVRDAARSYLLSRLAACGGDVRAVCRTSGVSQATMYRVLGGAVKGRFLHGKLTKSPERSEDDPSRIVAMLETFGVIIPPENRGNFWLKHEGRLDFLMHDAHKGYLSQVKLRHPDLNPEQDQEHMTRINTIWARLKRIMRKHGADC